MINAGVSVSLNAREHLPVRESNYKGTGNEHRGTRG